MPILNSSFARILLLLLVSLLLPLLWPGVLGNLWSTQGFELDHHETWRPALVSLHVGSDLLIGLAYTSIASILALIVSRNRAYLPFDWVVLAFGLFIVACGFTHVMHVVVRYAPIYWFDAYIRAITALVSVATALALPPLIPRISEALQATAALQRKEQELQHALTTNVTLLDIVQLAGQQGQALDVAKQVLLKFRDALDVDWLGLGVQEDEVVQLTGIWHSPQVTGVLTQTDLPPVQRGGMTWLAIEAQDAVYIDDYATHPRATRLYAQAGLSSVVMIPLTDPAAGNTIVLIASKVGEKGGWATWEKQLFDAARVAVNVAMERQQHLHQMEIGALRDALTNLSNRRAFEADLTREIARVRRHGSSLGLMMLDLDGMKVINDQLGHEAGDRLLRAFGQGLERQMRAEDRCYRLGGDEFAVILSHSSPESSATLHLRIAQLITGLQVGDFKGIGVSVGIAFCPAQELNPTALMRLADERMYEMKAQHRLERTAAG